MIPAVLKYILLTSIFLNFFLAPVYAQEEPFSGTVAENLEVAESVESGDILSLGADGIRKSTISFDSGMIGVVSEAPVISLGEKTDKTASIISSGRVQVKVTNAGGVIAPGDFITTSTTAGVGQKALGTGFVMGRALEAYDSSDVGKILVMADIVSLGTTANLSGVVGRLLTALLSGLGNAENFPEVLRYIAATVMGVVTFFLASISFVRFMRSGLDALGRNPLARSTIVAGMIMNAAMVFVLTLAGFGIAIAIIAL